MPFDTTNGLTDPELYGFAGGIDQDGETKQYVGYGNAEREGCANQPKCPGIITTVETGPGCYMTCGGILYDASTPFYLVNHPNLEWVATNITAMQTLTEAISIGTTVKLLFGRMQLDGLWTLGKVQNGGTGNVFKFYMDVNGQSVGYDTGFEVLTCKIPATTTTTTEAPCGKNLVRKKS